MLLVQNNAQYVNTKNKSPRMLIKFFLATAQGALIYKQTEIDAVSHTK